MHLRDAVATVHDAFSPAAALRLLGQLTTLDRYQASRDLERAADLVAEEAERAGLQAVEIRRHPAHGERSWWTFRAPKAWTPVRASLELQKPDGAWEPITEYPRDACCLAVYSAPTGPDPLTLRLVDAPDPRDHDSGPYLVTGDIAPGQEAGALGWVAHAGGREDADATGAVGRIELPMDSPHFAFSVTVEALSQTRAAAAQGRAARVSVVVDRSATMPVVTARLGGTANQEFLHVAHLCHQRPGANDNLSGVVAQLGIARVLAGLHKRRPRRGTTFVWGPEFVGTAAYLYEAECDPGWRPPRAVLNLDMVGEDQALCGGPLVLEGSAHHTPSVLEAVAEHAIRLLPPTAWTHAGTRAATTWNWTSTPFLGASDHMLLADRHFACPTIELGHWPDRFNHSSRDDLGKVDPAELRRAAAVAGGTNLYLSSLAPHEAGELARLVFVWAQGRLSDAMRESACASPGIPGTVDPRAAEHRSAYVSHLAGALIASLNAATGWGDVSARHLDAMSSALLRRAAEHDDLLASEALQADPSGHLESAGVLARCWPGPFNLRGLLEELPAARAMRLRRRLAGGGGAYAATIALANAIDGASPAAEVWRRAAYSSGVAIDAEHAQAFIDALVEVGWARAEEGAART